MNSAIFRYPETFKAGAVIGVFSGAVLFSPWDMPIPEWFFFCAFALFGLVLSYNQMDPKADEDLRKVSAYFQGFFLFGSLVFALVSWSIGAFRSIAVIVLSIIVSAYFCGKALGRHSVRKDPPLKPKVEMAEAKVALKVERLRESAIRLHKRAQNVERFRIKSSEDDNSPPPAA